MSHQSGESVPKFGSFKARGSARTANQVKDELHESTSNLKGHHEQQGSRHSRECNRSKQYQPRQSLASAVRLPTPTEETEEPESWFIDIRGDPKNVEYGCLHRPGIPQYHRFGQGSIIGAPPKVKVDRYQSTDQEIVLFDPQSSNTQRQGLSSKHGNVSKQAEATVLGGPKWSDGEQDFIDLKRGDAGLSDGEEAHSRIADTGIWSFIHGKSDI